MQNYYIFRDLPGNSNIVDGAGSMLAAIANSTFTKLSFSIVSKTVRDIDLDEFSL